MAIVKEHDGQVKTPQNRNREQDDGADNEIDGENAIKLYNELVKSLQDRLALEKELPALVAARVGLARHRTGQRHGRHHPATLLKDRRLGQGQHPPGLRSAGVHGRELLSCC